MASGITVSDKCVEVFEEMKLKKHLRYMILKLTPDHNNVALHEEGPSDKTFEDFLGVLHAARDSREGLWGIVDFPYLTKDGVNSTKLILVQWIHDSCKVKTKMVMAATWKNLKDKFTGIQKTIEATDDEDIEHKAFMDAASNK